VWRFADRPFEGNSHHLADHDSRSYDLNNADSNNDYLKTRVPDQQPTGGRLVPAPASQVLVRAHGSWTLPWPVFRQCANAIRSSGDIIEDLPAHQ
jgi:hypothetical protein